MLWRTGNVMENIKTAMFSQKHEHLMKLSVGFFVFFLEIES